MASAATPEERANLDRLTREAGGEPATPTKTAPRARPSAPSSGGPRALAADAGGAAVDYGTKTEATESVSIAIIVSLIAILIGARWFGQARTWVRDAVGAGGGSADELPEGRDDNRRAPSEPEEGVPLYG